MSQINEYYESYWREKKEYTVQQNSRVRRRHLKLLRWLYMSGLTQSSAVLDIGCGEAETVRLLMKLGHRVIGVDISLEVLLESKKRCPEANFVQQDLSFQLPFADRSFDLVLCLEVFEHLFSPYDLSCEIRRVLVPGGTLICSVPYHGLLKNIIIALIAFERHYRIDNPHIRFFTDRTFQRMIKTAGLQIIDFCHISSRIPFWPTNSMALCRKERWR